jgi:hypothetical protein
MAKLNIHSKGKIEVGKAFIFGIRVVVYLMHYCLLSTMTRW